MQKTIGGDRLGSGKRMTVNIHGYERSTHDLGYLFRTTMSAGTLVPFMCEIGLPGDTFDIGLDCDIKSHPTVGPLFGSYKAQLDVFSAGMRLYQAQLHNNKLGIGLKMNTIKLPQIRLYIDPEAVIDNENPDNSQINPSCILSYLKIRGIGVVDPLEPDFVTRDFMALYFLEYWDIYKNYYSNKQELFGWVIHKESVAMITTVDDIEINGTPVPTPPGIGTIENIQNQASEIVITYTGTSPILSQIIFTTSKGQFSAETIAVNRVNTAGTITFNWNWNRTGTLQLYGWGYISNSDLLTEEPQPWAFPLDTIDTMRENILAAIADTSPFIVNENMPADSPYELLLAIPNNLMTYKNTQEGLGLKTYQSDMYNNWLSTEWIDGPGGINEITAIDTTSGSFNIDTFILMKKVWTMLNRIAISGGTYDDWIDAVYTNERVTRAETPIYHGGLIKELVFQEVISNSETASNNQGGGGQPLGTLGGRGVLSKKHKGGNVTIKVGEPSVIMGIVSLTPRIDYSQGNGWEVHLENMDDLHKPALDEIGFQDLPTEQMAWWDTVKTLAGTTFTINSAGKQPAWIQYMTNTNRVLGNFAIPDNEMFMTLNRRYEKNTSGIEDLTTYIDPAKFNYSFAETAIDAQNFWVQIAIDMTVRRKMSAKLMPNL